MSLLDRLERRIEQVIEGFFTRWAGHRIHPFEIGRQLLRELDRESVSGAHGLVLPNVYRVFLNPEDFTPYRNVGDALVSGFLDALHTRAEELGGRFEGPLRITIAPGDEVAPGAIAVLANVVTDAGPPAMHVRPPQDIGPRLRVLSDPSGPPGGEFALGGPTTTIGRGADQAIVLRDSGVSRMHARIDCGPEGVTIVDLGSTNGTIVNGRRLRAAGAPLHGGDRIQIGRVIFEFLPPR